tara:strand:- start:218 stop:394 length:177 start_codon:yes stop_codon:yes gene_type:complete
MKHKDIKKAVGMHKMPDGSMMAGKSHAMQKGGMVKMNMGGMVRGGGIESKGKSRGRVC